LVEMQRRLAMGRRVVTEGRDQGTVAFPQAECKFYLTASAEERARRRQDELRAKGQEVPLAEVLEQQNLRDAQDESRDVGALVPAADAIHVQTDGMALDEVVELLERLARERGIGQVPEREKADGNVAG
jgi:CMP/dCMP kinase